MVLTGPQLKILRKGIIGAYPDKEALKMLLAEEIEESFDTIAKGSDYNTQVFNLIQDFEANGRLEELIRVMIRDKPNNPNLEQIKDEFADLLIEKIVERSHDPISSNLITEPPLLKTWVGREEAITQLQAWITDPSVTLIGIQGLGGVGKSALAAYLYNQQQIPVQGGDHNFRFWADVSQRPDFVSFAEGIIMGLGGKIIPQGDISLVVNQLINFLNQKSCLLVVDNLETLLTETEEWQDSGYEQFFSRWLQQGRTSTLLLTTREKPKLFERVGWEYWHLLGGLQRSEGVRLLQELKIKGTEAELEAFAQSLDGHPLTLRLVAGFLREYCGGELSRVDELRLEQEELIFKEAAGLHHDRSDARLSWILDQHLQRLSPQQHCFLLNLTVYRQPFNREAASWMCNSGDIEATTKPIDIQKALKELVNRSLLLEIGGNRFQFQVLVQRFLQKEKTNFTPAHQQAIKYYISHLKPEPWDSFDDVSEYLEACYHHYQLQQYAEAYAIVDICYNFFDLQAYHQTLVEIYDILAHKWQPESREDKTNRGWAWIRLGRTYYWLNQYEQDIECQHQAKQIFSELGYPYGEAWSLCYLGNAYTSTAAYEESNYEKAIRFHKEALKIAKKIDDKDQKAIIFAAVFGGLGFSYCCQRNYKMAIKYSQESLKVKQKINDIRGEFYSLGDLGSTYYNLTDYKQAIECHKKQLKIAKDIGDIHGEAVAFSNLALSYYANANYQDAISFWEEAINIISDRLGDQSWKAHTLTRLGNAYYSLGIHHKARELHEQTLLTAKEYTISHIEAHSLSNLGNVYYALEDYTKAKEYYLKSLELRQKIHDPWGEASTLSYLGNAYNVLGQYEKAIELHLESLKIVEQIGRRDVEANAYCGLGDVYRSLEQYTDSRDCYQQSLDIAKEINYRRGEADASFSLGLALIKLNFPSDAVEALQNARQLYQEMGLETKVQECNSEIEKLG